MRKSRLSAEQISTALRQVESGAPVAEVTRKLGVSEKTYYLWKKQYAQPKLQKSRCFASATDATSIFLSDLLSPADERRSHRNA